MGRRLRLLLRSQSILVHEPKLSIRIHVRRALATAIGHDFRNRGADAEVGELRPEVATISGHGHVPTVDALIYFEIRVPGKVTAADSRPLESASLQKDLLVPEQDEDQDTVQPEKIHGLGTGMDSDSVRFPESIHDEHIRGQGKWIDNPRRSGDDSRGGIVAKRSKRSGVRRPAAVIQLAGGIVDVRERRFGFDFLAANKLDGETMPPTFLRGRGHLDREFMLQNPLLGLGKFQLSVFLGRQRVLGKTCLDIIQQLGIGPDVSNSRSQGLPDDDITLKDSLDFSGTEIGREWGASWGHTLEDCSLVVVWILFFCEYQHQA